MNTTPDPLVVLSIPGSDPAVLPWSVVVEGQRRGRDMGLVPTSAPCPPPVAGHQSERWLDSRELAELTGIGDTTLETWAARGAIPSIRAGKALRFKASEVEAALRLRDSVTPAHTKVLDSNGRFKRRNHNPTTQTRSKDERN